MEKKNKPERNKKSVRLKTISKKNYGWLQFVNVT